MKPRCFPAPLLLLFPVLACSDPASPGLHGPEFFSATVNHVAWNPGLPVAACEDFAFQVSMPVGSVISGNDLLRMTVLNADGPGVYTLGDSSSGRFAMTANLRAVGPIHRTHAGNGDRLTISQISFADSMALGSFHFLIVSDSNPTQTYDFAGTFRLKLSAIYTVSHPEGTPCFGAP